MDLFKMAGLDASEFSNNNTNTLKPKPTVKVQVTKVTHQQTQSIDESDNSLKDIQRKAVTSADQNTSKAEYFKRERDRINTSILVNEALLKDLYTQLVMLERGSDGSADNIKRISSVKYRISRLKESIEGLNKKLKKLN